MATLKGVFPDPKPVRRKNFIHENVKNLRRMEQFFHTNKELEELQKLQIQKHHRTTDKYQNVSSRVNSSFANTKQQQTDVKVGGPVLRSKSPKTYSPLKSNPRAKRATLRGAKIPSEPILNQDDIDAADQPKFRSRGIQTLDDDCMDELYAEGTIRYPRSRSPRQPTDKTPIEEQSPPSDRGDISHETSHNPPGISPTPSDGVDFVKLNKQHTSVASKMATQLNHGVPPANYRKGVVPKYLRERKEAKQQEEEKSKAEMLPADCPEGHVPLPDSERKETLRMLKKSYQEYVNELNKMPIKTDTLRSQRRKMEIEKQLTKIEEGIKVFSRPKVYVKVNA